MVVIYVIMCDARYVVVVSAVLLVSVALLRSVLCDVVLPLSVSLLMFFMLVVVLCYQWWCCLTVLLYVVLIIVRVVLLMLVSLIY